MNSSFLESILPAVVKYKKATNSPLFISVVLAQAALESDWGQSELARNANSIFGHKYDGNLHSDHYVKDAYEAVNGNDIVDKDAMWGKYPSIEACIEQHMKWLTSSTARTSIYKNAINATTPDAQAKALMGTYATDEPRATSIGYYAKLMSIINTHDLTKEDITVAPSTPTTPSAQKGGYIGLDIGHGANTRETGGGKAVYKNGKWHEEHDFNSAVAKRLKALLEAAGHKVTYGAQQPYSNEVGLTTRSNRFNADKVDILISVHANWWSDPNTNGVSAFYDRYTQGSTRATQSYRLAKLIMDAYRGQGQRVYSTGEIASYSGNWTDFHMNRVPTMPSVLMELGFMSGNVDFDKVFGAQQAKYVEEMAQGMVAGVNAYFGVTSATKPVVNTYNPSNMPEVAINPYMPPELQFKRLAVGDKVTFRDTFNGWYNPDTKNYMLTPRAKDIRGTKDEIVEVFNTNRGYSQVGYLVKGYQSIVLEQDLVEPRAHWSTPVQPDETVDEDEFTVFELGGEKFKIEKVENP